MIQALRSHHINTLVELRRIERAFAVLGSPDVTEPMTAACELQCQVGGYIRLMDARVVLRQQSQSTHRNASFDEKLPIQVFRKQQNSLDFVLALTVFVAPSVSMKPKTVYTPIL